eukprot:TRINITY_DN23988_c0_g1_i1.p1 TRINITY_DN23988_c0_g1~~TRINITY_DN23988_c0_g1_i1.p1  ORF type:complete len:961 (+),score=134.33 TRINITY_DN23988_c0_g1_i1:67-2949(+)
MGNSTARLEPPHATTYGMHRYDGIFHNRTDAIAYIDKQGHFGFASRDFWIVVAICWGGTLLSLAVVYFSVEFEMARAARAARELEDSDEEDSEDEECDELKPGMTPWMPEKPVAQPGFLQRSVFRADIHGREFASSLELSLRGALAALFCASTYWYNSLSWWQNQGWAMTDVIVMVAFTLWKDLGTTVSLAWSAFYGTLMAIANCWFMYYFYPFGIGEGQAFSHAWWFCWLDFVVFVVIMIVFNFATNAKMFALSWQAYFTMCFINPWNTTVFSNGLLSVTFKSGDMGALMSTVWGCSIALVAALIPNLMSALKMARDTVLDLTWSHGRLLEELIEHGAADVGSQESLSFSNEVREFRKQIEKLEEYLANSWWESFDMGRSGRSRLRLSKLSYLMRELNDWLEYCTAAAEQLDHNSPNSSDGRAANILGRLKPELREVWSPAWALLHRYAILAASGSRLGCDSKEESELQTLLEDLGAAQARLMTRCCEERMGWNGLGFNELQLPQFALAYGVSGYCQQVADGISEMLDIGDEGLEGRNPWYALIDGILALPRGVHIRNNIKLMLTYFLCFAIGRNGLGYYPRWVFTDFNSTPAGTVSYLIFQGGNRAAAIKKNVDRFIGVSFGTMVGQLLLSGSCLGNPDQSGELRDMPWFVLTFLVFWGSMFVTYSYDQWSYVGLLTCAFFAQHALASNCDKVLQDQTSLANYQNILAQLVAIVCATIMDMVTDRPMAMSATDALEGFTKTIDLELNKLEELGSHKVHAQALSTGREQLRDAVAAGASAALEPRISKAPWRTDLFDCSVVYLSESWRFVGLLSYVCSRSGPGDAASKASMQIALASPTFLKEREHLRARIARVSQLTLQFLRKDFYGDENETTQTLEEKLLHSRKIALRAKHMIIAEIGVGLARQSSGGGASSMLEDVVCELSAMVIMLQAVAARVERLEEALLEQPEMMQRATRRGR